jgi:hypothetical protein
MNPVPYFYISVVAAVWRLLDVRSHDVIMKHDTAAQPFKLFLIPSSKKEIINTSPVI